eukprot:COSAG02_NODE_34258_length_487_cov_0.283505_2_plen_31_part_01
MVTRAKNRFVKRLPPLPSERASVGPLPGVR